MCSLYKAKNGFKKENKKIEFNIIFIPKEAPILIFKATPVLTS